MAFLELVSSSSQAVGNSFAFVPGADSYGTAAGKSNNSLFESILSSSRSRYHQSATGPPKPYKASESGKNLENGKNSTAGFLSFREARDYSTKATSRVTVEEEAIGTARHDEAIDGDERNGENFPGQCAGESIMQITAQLLGIGMDELQWILGMTGTASWHASGITGTDEMALCLSQKLGLNDEQQDILAELLGIAVKSTTPSPYDNAAVQAGIEENMCVVTEAEYRAAPCSAANDGNSIAAREDTESFIEKLSEYIKMRLDEFRMPPDVDKAEAGEETETMMTLPAGNADGKAKLELQKEEAETVMAPASAHAAEGTEIAEKKHADAESGAGTNTSMPYDNISRDNSDRQKIPAGEELQTAVQTMAVNQARENLAAITGKDTETFIQPRDIISQVVEKVKVILTPEKSEISMELKPDSLGRVSLKVSAENGLVMARFIAENQQVKQVLEANMQILKDSLERQGINVQGFSVSVRQESEGYPESGSGHGENGRMVSPAKAYKGSLLEGDVAERTGVFAANSAYLWTYSTIDLTA